MSSGEQNPTKGQPLGTDEAPDAATLEELEKVIAENAPEFSVADISSAEAASDLNLELLDLDQLLSEQEARSIRSRLRRLRNHVRNFALGLWTTLSHFVKNEVPILAKKSLAQAKAGGAAAGATLKVFLGKPLRFKLYVLGFGALCLVVAVSLWILLTRTILSSEDRLFVQSMAELSDKQWEYEEGEQEPFYDSGRAAQNILEITKLVVNIRRSSNSGPNPMMAGALYLEGNSPDVVVEIKDREVEFRDHFMRTVEEFTYDDLDTVQGKERLQDRLAREANRLTTKGRVRRVYFQAFVLKP